MIHSYCDDVGGGVSVSVCECEQPPLLNISLKGESCYVGNLQLGLLRNLQGVIQCYTPPGNAGSQGQETQVQVSIHSLNLRHRVCSCRAKLVFKFHLVHWQKDGVCSWTNSSLRVFSCLFVCLFEISLMIILLWIATYYYQAIRTQRTKIWGIILFRVEGNLTFWERHIYILSSRIEKVLPTEGKEKHLRIIFEGLQRWVSR